MKLFYSQEGTKVRFWQSFISLGLLVFFAIVFFTCPMLTMRVPAGRTTYTFVNQLYDFLNEEEAEALEKGGDREAIKEKYDEYRRELEEAFDIREGDTIPANQYRELAISFTPISGTSAAIRFVILAVAEANRTDDNNVHNNAYSAYSEENEDDDDDSDVTFTMDEAEVFASGMDVLKVFVCYTGFFDAIDGGLVSYGIGAVLNLFILFVVVILSVILAIQLIIALISSLTSLGKPEEFYGKTGRWVKNIGESMIALVLFSCYFRGAFSLAFVPVIVAIACFGHAFMAHLKKSTREERTYLWISQGVALVGFVGSLLLMVAASRYTLTWLIGNWDYMTSGQITKAIFFMAFDMVPAFANGIYLAYCYRLARLSSTVGKGVTGGRARNGYWIGSVMIVFAVLFFVLGQSVLVRDGLAPMTGKFVLLLVGSILILGSEIAYSILKKQMVPEVTPEEMRQMDTGFSPDEEAQKIVDRRMKQQEEAEKKENETFEKEIEARIAQKQREAAIEEEVAKRMTAAHHENDSSHDGGENNA